MGKVKDIVRPDDVDPQMSLIPEYDWNYVDISVERVVTAWILHHNMNPDGKKMLVAFSGGKDSICLFFICKKASEKVGLPMEQMFHVQYNITCVDPPELVWFIRDFKKQYPFIEMHQPEKTMWELIATRKMPPTRVVRYCCSDLKEISSFRGGYSLTGVRRAESSKRADRQAYEALGNKSAKFGTDHILLNDNEDRRATEFCMQENKYVCNPIIDWTDKDVWNFIKHENLPYCSLYDEGFHRLGCIGCPLGKVEQRVKEFERWPKYADCYKRAFQKMLDNGRAEKDYEWKNGEEVFDWWLYGTKNKETEQEEMLFSLNEEPNLSTNLV